MELIVEKTTSHSSIFDFGCGFGRACGDEIPTLHLRFELLGFGTTWDLHSPRCKCHLTLRFGASFVTAHLSLCYISKNLKKGTIQLPLTVHDSTPKPSHYRTTLHHLSRHGHHQHLLATHDISGAGADTTRREGEREIKLQKNQFPSSIFNNPSPN